MEVRGTNPHAAEKLHTTFDAPKTYYSWPSVSIGDWFQSPPDPEIHGCSNPLYEIV